MTDSVDAPQEALAVQLMGGLGNQMFIAAFGATAAAVSGRDLILDISAAAKSTHQQEPDLFEFGSWRDCRTSSTAFGGKTHYADAISRRIGVRRRGLYQEFAARPGFIGFDDQWRQVLSVKRARGYFQSWKYWADALELTRALFAPAVQGPTTPTLAGLTDGPFIAAHVRRGDYLDSVNIDRIGICSDSYFVTAIAALKSEGLASLPVAVFTDSPQLLMPELLRVADLVVGPDESGTPAQTLTALRGASGLVMSNSSFSWWAAFLSDSGDRPVIAPDPWFRSVPHRPEDLLLPSWRRWDAR